MATSGFRKPGALRRFVLLENWTLLDPEEMRLRRASWPTWRRALRPIVEILYFGGFVVGVFYPHFDSPKPWSLQYYVTGVLFVIMVGSAVLGLGLEWRDRHREGRTMFGHPRRHLATRP